MRYRCENVDEDDQDDGSDDYDTSLEMVSVVASNMFDLRLEGKYCEDS